ncbi:MAG: YihY/virulence factor BrkB family protein [Humibacillus sp.]|nr:YihY/virulence factor BrkB family protein [Humibacillus sp.]MDN5777292.1 YihY/virulence factor BrkB family protein [Humibacillus sp.]
MTSLKRLWQTITRLRPYTAYQRYGKANGNLLASGVAYYSFFSIFPAIALAFTIFGFVLQGRPDLLDAIADQLNQTIPNLIKTPTVPNGLISISAPTTTALTITGLVAFVTLLLAGLGWIGALRTGVRAVFGLGSSPGNPVLAKLRDVAVLVALGAGIAVSAAVSSVAGGLTTQVADAVGLGGEEWIVTTVGLLLGLAFDSGLMVLMIRVLSGVPLPWRNVREGAIVGGLLLGVLKFFGSALIANATKNALGAVAVAVGLLVWLNLMARVILLAAAWAAAHVDIATIVSGEAVNPFARVVRPAFVVPLTATADTALVPYAGGPPRSDPTAAPDPMASTPHESNRAGDRVSVAAGAVLGAVSVLGISGLRRFRSR